MRPFAVAPLSLLILLLGSACDGCDPGGLSDGGALGVQDAGGTPLLDAGEGDGGQDEGDAGAPLRDAGSPPVDAGDDDAGQGDGGQQQGDAGHDDAGPQGDDAGSAAACLSSRACSPPAVCSDLRDEGDEVAPYCRALEAGGAGTLGALCAGGSDCETGLCLPRAEACSVACEDAALDCQNGGVCTAYPFEATSGESWIGVCAPGCAGDDDCPAGRVCTYNGNLPADLFDAVCEVPVGQGDLGAACESGADCRTGLCLPGEGCTRVCDDGGDCAGGPVGNPMGGCEEIEVFSPSDEGSAFLKMCR